MRRLRRPTQPEETVEVAMSPLIDCVFLLLIFFLVTTMMKKMEKQIPITLPDSTSAIADQPDERLVVIGIDENGSYLRDSGKRDGDGNPLYEPIPDLAIFLRETAESGGAQRPLRVDAAPRAPFQKVIDTLDICHIQGFEHVGVRLKKKD